MLVAIAKVGCLTGVNVILTSVPKIGQTLKTCKKLVSEHMISFRNTFTAMVQARLSVKDNAAVINSHMCHTFTST